MNEIFNNCKLRSYPEDFATTVKALPTDTLISGQLYLRPPSQNPVFLNSYTNSVFSHSRKRPALVMDTFLRPDGVRLRELPLYFEHLLDNDDPISFQTET